MVESVAAVLPARRPRANLRVEGESICDTHNHVFGPFDRFPLRHEPAFPVPLAPVATYLDMLDRIGAGRGVLVQPTQQGCDNTDVLHGLKAAGGRLRAVGALRDDATEETFAELDRVGVRSLRFAEVPLPNGARRPGAVEFAEIPKLARRIAAQGWAIDVWAKLPRLLECLDATALDGFPVIFEHMGMFDIGAGLAGRDFQTMLGLLREGRIHVKLSICRCSTAAPEYADLRPFHDALVETNPEQLVWGSDWPHIRMAGREPDAGDLLDLFLEWTGDAALQRRILIENPARLYGFGKAE